MICPKCIKKGKRVSLKVTHSFSSDASKLQRLTCPNCYLVATAQTLITEIDPPRGKGAATLAKKAKIAR